MKLLNQIKSKEIHIVKDLIAGLVVMLVSIPISMGYAQIAGLPAVYGLYGSVFPILLFALVTSSPQFIVGVDAMPAAMVGGLLAELGIAGESEAAFRLIPVISILVALWFILFYYMKAGRIVKYISSPVMGGFISGVAVTIILMQIPKLFGGQAGTGEVFVLLSHIWSELPSFHMLSFLLSMGTIAIILVSKRLIPKIPMTVIMLFLGAILQCIFHLDGYGVKLLPTVTGGLPKPVLPNLTILADANIVMHLPQIFLQSLSIAAVIMAQTLLATGNYAARNNDEIDNGRELMAYCAMNVASAFVGCCPVNGSVSRSGIADSFGMRSQLASISAGLSMILVLLFGTKYLSLLPVPVLTGIVLTALIGIIDFKMMKRLWKDCRNEWVIFMISFAGVLIFGTVYGVVIGCFLSFWEVAIRAVNPPAAFEGRIPGQGNFYSLKRNKQAKAIAHTVIYRFSGNLFFANIDRFLSDIEAGIGEDTKQVIVDARGIGSIDISAMDRLVSFYRKLQAKGIRFYISEHDGSLNDEMRRLGAGCLIEEGVVRRTISLCLRDAGVEKPYRLEDGTFENENEASVESDERLSEFEWAFGEHAEAYMEKLAETVAEEMASEISEHMEPAEIVDQHSSKTKWGLLGHFDESEFFDFLENRIEELVEEGKLSKESAQALEERIEERRVKGEKRLLEINPHATQLLKEHREHVLSRIKEKNPEEYQHLMKLYSELRNKKRGENHDTKQEEQ